VKRTPTSHLVAQKKLTNFIDVLPSILPAIKWHVGVR
jgi:hypothetical protein